MAAIKPHLAQEGETTKLQREYWRCSGSSGLGDVEACPAPEEIAQEAHAELMNVAWIRQAIIEKMGDRKIWIEYDNDGTPAIAIDRPVEAHPGTLPRVARLRPSSAGPPRWVPRASVCPQVRTSWVGRVQELRRGSR